jgi:hypothetical protein
MISTKFIRAAAVTGVLSLGLLAGCKSDQQKALEQAEAQATSTNTPQTIQYVDGNGNTVTTTVQPPAAPGQQPQVSTTTTPPVPGTKPPATKPVITSAAGGPAYNANGQVVPPTAVAGQNYAAQNTANGQAYPASGTTAPPPPADGNYATPNEPAYPNGTTTNAPAQANYSLTVPAGTELAVRINQNINVKHTQAGDHFTGEIASAVERDGQVVIPRGTPVRGRVDASHRRGHFKGSSILELRLTSMVINGHEYALDTHDNVHTKKGKGKRTAGFIGGIGGAGALIGGIASGGVGLAIGAASGAGAGTILAGATGNRDINIPAESIQHFRLADDLVVQNP